MLKRLPFYILIALGILAFKFYGEYDGSAIAHPEWIAGAGVACWLLAGVFIWLRGSRALQKENHTWQQKISDLKANGEMIRVPAAECELKENQHNAEYISQPGEVVSEAEEILREMMYLPNR